MTQLLPHRSKNLWHVYRNWTLILLKLSIYIYSAMGSVSVKYFVLVIPRCSRSKVYEREDLQLISVSHRYDQLYLFLYLYRDSISQYFFPNNESRLKIREILHTNITNSPIATITYARHKSGRIKWSLQFRFSKTGLGGRDFPLQWNRELFYIQPKDNDSLISV